MKEMNYLEKYLIGAHIEAYPYENTKLSIYNKNTAETFVIGEKEANVFKMMNGANTVKDIQNECSYYSEEEIIKLADAFSKIGLFDKKKAKFNPLKIKLPLFNPNKFLKENGIVSKILHYSICIGAPVFFLISFIAMGILNPEPMTYVSNSLAAFATIRAKDIIIIAVLSLLSLAFHEFGHMITARRYGVNVPEIGVMLYFLIPCAYTNITGINLLKSKGKRLMVLLSGTLVNIGLIGICYMLMAFNVSVSIGMYCIALIVINMGTVFMNTMVFIKFDGYYVMETIIDEPKLRENSFAHIFNLVKVLFDKNHEAKNLFRAANNEESNLLKHVTYCTYSILSVLYVPIIMLSTVIPYVF